MVSVVCWGVGTGYDSGTGCPTGTKDVFEYNERIYASHCWTGLSGGESFRIQWQREVAGVWQTEALYEWTNPDYYTAHQYSWIQNYPSGNWRANFFCGGYGPYRTYFTIKSQTISIEETINWEGSVASGSHTFYLFSLYGTNTNNTIAGFQIEKGTYKTASITSPGQSRQDSLITQDVLKDDCLTIIAEDYNTSTGQISGIYDAEIKSSVI